MSAFSTGALTGTNEPQSATLSGVFGMGGAGADADILRTELSALTTRLSELTQDFKAFVEAVDEKWETKQDVLEFDTEPTQHSGNPVTSGGVYDALQALDITLMAGAMLRWPCDAAIPEGWHVCDGSTFDATAHPTLYSLLATDKLPEEYGSIIKLD